MDWVVALKSAHLLGCLEYRLWDSNPHALSDNAF